MWPWCQQRGYNGSGSRPQAVKLQDFKSSRVASCKTAEEAAEQFMSIWGKRRLKQKGRKENRTREDGEQTLKKDRGL